MVKITVRDGDKEKVLELNAKELTFLDKAKEKDIMMKSAGRTFETAVRLLMLYEVENYEDLTEAEQMAFLGWVVEQYAKKE